MKIRRKERTIWCAVKTTSSQKNFITEETLIPPAVYRIWEMVRPTRLILVWDWVLNSYFKNMLKAERTCMGLIQESTS